MRTLERRDLSPFIFDIFFTSPKNQKTKKNPKTENLTTFSWKTGLLLHTQLQQHLFLPSNLLPSSHSPRHWNRHPVLARHHMSRCEYWSDEDAIRTASAASLSDLPPSALNSLTVTLDWAPSVGAAPHEQMRTRERGRHHTQLQQHFLPTSNLLLSTHSPRQPDWAPSCGRGIT